MAFFGLFKKKYETVSPAEAHRLSKEGAFFIDVRTPAEYKSGHASGTRNVPLQNLQNRLHELPKGRPILVICQSGARSATACNFLSAQGYQVTNVSGGTANWIRAGLSTSR